MLTFGKLAKKQTLDLVFPGPDCADPRCLDLCAEACDAALSLRLDPKEVLRKTIQRELHCLPANDGDSRACRFGYLPASDALVLSVRKKEERGEVVHIFRTGVNECKKCQALEGTRITPEIWADEEKMRSKGFWKQKNGEYLPHPNCKCHWEEEFKSKKTEEAKMGLKRTENAGIVSNDEQIAAKWEEKSAYSHEFFKPSSVAEKHPGEIKFATPKEIAEAMKNSVKSKSTSLTPYTDRFLSLEKVSPYDRQQAYMYATPQNVKLQEVEFRVKDSPGRWGKNSREETIDGFEDLLEKIEKRYKPHSIGLLRIMGHGSPGDTTIGVSHPDSFDELYRNNNARSRSITARLKKMLSDDAVVEFLMCDVGQNGGKGKNGPEVAQKIANHLGCRVKVFTEKINPYGGKDIWWFIPAKYDIYNPNLEK